MFILCKNTLGVYIYSTDFNMLTQYTTNINRCFSLTLVHNLCCNYLSQTVEVACVHIFDQILSHDHSCVCR